jgi:small subunit ribosomal protein S8
MTMTDPIADLLSRIRNALQARHASVDIPASRLKLEIARILKGEGYIDDFKAIEQGPQGAIRIALKYGPGGEGAISGLERVSRPGRRVYCGKGEIPTVLGGLGINILSTPKGLLTGTGCQQQGVGGEILCNIW